MCLLGTAELTLDRKCNYLLLLLLFKETREGARQQQGREREKKRIGNGVVMEEDSDEAGTHRDRSESREETQLIKTQKTHYHFFFFTSAVPLKYSGMTQTVF